MTAEMSAGDERLVHGMAADLVEPDWPPIGEVEALDVLAHFELAGASRPTDAVVTWRSPRPMSAAAIVRVGDRSVFLKRHHTSVRDASRLILEHQFIGHLADRGESLPAVLMTLDGASVLERDDVVYEAHEVARGLDLYRATPSWFPYRVASHARAAGRALANFHRAAADFAAPAWPMGVLSDSIDVISSRDPLEAIREVVARRPGLARSTSHYRLARDVERYLVEPIATAATRVRALSPQWTHGDWHPSNLTWSSARADATVCDVVDLGLANRTVALHDLAVAIERGVIDWLDVAGVGTISVDDDALGALLAGYDEVLALTDDDAESLAAILPVAHVEFALSEVEYFGDVVDASINRDLAYHGYLLGHARWFASAAGAQLLAHLRLRGSW